MRGRVRVALVGLYCDHERTNVLSLGYLKAFAESRPDLEGRARVDLLEAGADELPAKELARRIRALKPDIVGFSCFVWNIGKVRSTAALLKRSSRIRVVLGGPEVSRRPESALREVPAADFVVSGEGEETFADLLRWRLDGGVEPGGPPSSAPSGRRLGPRGKDLARIPGLSWRRGKGAAPRGRGVVVNKGRRPVADVDALPSPYLLRLYDFDASGCGRAALETLRGCPFDCAFCAWTDSRRVRCFSEERLRREVRELARSSRHLDVFVADSDTFMSRARAKRLLRLFREENPSGKLTIGFNTYLGYIDRELAGLADHESFVFAAGLESANPKVLRACRRRLDVAAFKRGAALLRRHAPKAKVYVQLMLGMPEDDLNGFRRSLDLALGMRLSGCDVFHFQVLPGTGFWRDPRRYGLRWETEPPYRVLSTRTFPPSDLREARRTAHAVGLLMSLDPVRALLDRELSAKRTSPLALLESLAAHIEGSGAFSLKAAFERWERLPWREQTLVSIRWGAELTGAQRQAIARALRSWSRAGAAA